jgi:hypothetical protein
MTRERWDRAKQLSPDAVLERNLKVATWADCYEVALGAKASKDDAKFLRALAQQVLDPGETKLFEARGLIVWERISRGELLFLGKGLQIDDDLLDSHTATCLRSVYGVDRLPEDPGAPAQLCSPDPWIHRYLAALTPETARHDAAWWSDWWKRNRERLRWDPKQGRFVPPS